MPAKKEPEAEALTAIADALYPLYHVEQLSDHLGELFTALDALARATALRVIAEHGSTKDRERAVELLKEWFEEW